MDCCKMSHQLPHHVSIPGELYPSRVITVSGIVPHKAKRFYINLCTDTDIAFHFNPRFDENTVVRNTEIQGVWGTEERSLPFNMPFRQGHSFTVAITCQAECYSVSVDGEHLLDFAYRLKDLWAIVHLEVNGDLEFSSVSV
ncbi:galectin-9-like isoform X1 [Octodon degus]|uniref:Galectin n=1 Tax=Octodon degus TaxID=10160 RepID=A0A6P6ETS9_OCTDE|nr:galectin-9-like isoform X1 [Octodon degus]